jgi:transmembrane sensor
MAESKDLIQRIVRATARIDPGLTERDVDRLVHGVHRRKRRRTAQRVCAGAIAGGLGALLLVRVGRWPAPAVPAASGMSGMDVASANPFGPPLRLDDGSVATPLESGSELAVVEQSRQRVSLALGRGRERFEVAPAPERPFSVRAGDVTVTVVGTVFTVERVADRVGVLVEQGTVRVDWESGTRYLGPGESGWFPPLLVRAEPSAHSAPPPQHVARVGSRDVPSAEVHASPNSPARSPAEELLSAADAARLAGRTEEGANLLYRLLREHGSDPRAPLAAFTLGRVLMMELGRPRDAAAAFATVRTLQPSGPFAEDALAREVEAWAKARQPDRARARALEYVRLYPNGRRTDSVRSYGRVGPDGTEEAGRDGGGRR